MTKFQVFALIQRREHEDFYLLPHTRHPDGRAMTGVQRIAHPFQHLVVEAFYPSKLGRAGEHEAPTPDV